MISRKNQTKYIQNKTKNEGIENACVCTTTYCLFTENKEAVTIKKIVLNLCSCYNLSDFCDKFV